MSAHWAFNNNYSPTHFCNDPFLSNTSDLKFITKKCLIHHCNINVFLKQQILRRILTSPPFAFIWTTSDLKFITIIYPIHHCTSNVLFEKTISPFLLYWSIVHHCSDVREGKYNTINSPFPFILVYRSSFQ